MQMRQKPGLSCVQTILLFIVLGVSASVTTWGQEVEANPGRPTVSTPATLTPVGYLQFESGVLGAEHSEEFANRTGINEVVKLSLNKRLELLLQTEPLVLADDGFQSIRKPGDISAGLQLVLVDGGDRKPTLAVSYFRQLYSSPAPDLDIGSSRN